MSSKRQSVPTGIKSYIRTHLDDIRPVLEVAEPWAIEDLPMDMGEACGVTRSLFRNNVIEKVGKDHTKGHNQTCWVWSFRFREQPRAYAEDYLESKNTLPCGHTAHIHHRDGKYGCKHCEQERDYSRETIENAL
jgi:hypothetical protein